MVVNPTVADSPARRPGSDPRARVAASPAGAARIPDWRSSPFLVSAVVCVALAALSAAILPTVPSYDPWSWIVWGREVFDPHLSFTVSGGPSWKPLPVIFTAVYGLFGGASPTLWVITARAGGLLALVAAYRLASLLVRSWLWAVGGRDASGARLGTDRRRAVRRDRRRAHPGVRPTTCSAGPPSRCSSVPRCGRSTAISPAATSRRSLLGVAASLIRPEAWPFVLLYAVWLWRRDRERPQAVFVGRRARVDPVLLVRAAVDRDRPAVHRREPREGLQRPSRRAPVHRGDAPRRSTCSRRRG